MNDQERNFRTHYYEKVGFRAVEEKKSVEILLKDQPIKLEKLKNFCLRFGIPAVYRTYVWKLLLGILPANQPSHNFVWQHRAAQAEELRRVTLLCRPMCLDLPAEELMLRMHLTEEGSLPLVDSALADCPYTQHFLYIAKTTKAMMEDEEGDESVYWIASMFYRHIRDNIHPTITNFSEVVLQCLAKEDSDGRLSGHLAALGLAASSLLDGWFLRCFAGTLPESALERVWDRVVGGSAYILVYCAVSVLRTLRRPLLALSSTPQMLAYLSQIPEDCKDRIVNDALDMLHKNCCVLSGKPDSPYNQDNPQGLAGKVWKPRHGSIENSHSSPVDKAVKSLIDKKSVTIEIARKSPNTEKIG